MLETTMATRFVPGTNLKGEVAGANWTFLLPTLEVKQVVVLGKPSPAALTTLKRLGQVTVVMGVEQIVASFIGEEGEKSLVGVHTLVRGEGMKLAIADSCTDLVVIADDRYGRMAAGDEELLVELQRILKPEGVVYFESGGGRSARQRLGELVVAFGGAKSFWLTPAGGECHTAVPVESRRTIRYFLDKELHSPSLTSRSFGPVKKLLEKRQSGRRVDQVKRAKAESNGSKTQSQVSLQSRLLPRVRSLGKRVLQGVADGERLLLKYVPFTRRQGALIGSSQVVQPGRPPHYLAELAAEAGVALETGGQWGVVARGDYSSRKVLFFLFDASEEMTLRFVVKMVRDPQYNYRLENEERALSLLEEMEGGEPGRVPRVAFSGYHNRLAIIGETAIEGAPFRERTTATAACPYLLDALAWFTRLAAGSAERQAKTPTEVAGVLRTLFTRFTEIYRLHPAYEAFLEEQLATVAASDHRFPLVFQHGDPGPWNAVVTPEEKVAFLDWEAAEPQGMPLWDLFYFMRSYAVGAARALGTDDRLQGFAEQLLADTALSRLVIDKVGTYREQIGLHSSMVEPLFYTCWIHRALKESTRLSPAQLEHGHYVNLLRLCIERRAESMLDRLFSNRQATGERFLSLVRGETNERIG